MPKQFLKGIDRQGLARGLFHDLRFDGDGRPRDGFILNRNASTQFLIVGANFGCGSSREHAVWGMLQFGIRAIIGTSFAGIFADNAANNGLLLISLAPQEVASLQQKVTGGANPITVDLDQQSITAGDFHCGFEIEASRRKALMLGLDRIGETLTQADRIRGFEQGYLGQRPWLGDAAT